MSAATTIGVGELAAICEWLDSVHRAGPAVAAAGGDRLREWCEARGIELDALLRFARDQTNTMIRELAEGKVELIEGIQATAIVGFQLGIDAERRRRNDLELP